MAKLPSRDDLGRLPLDGGNRGVASAVVPSSRGIGAGLQNLGGAIAGIGDKFDAALREQERTESAAALADLTKMSLDLDTKYLEDNDYTSRTERYMGEFDNGVQGIASSIKSDKVRNNVLLHAGEMAAKKQLSYTKRSMDEGNSDALAKLQQENEYRISKAAGLNDDQFAEQVLGGQARIRSLAGGRGPMTPQRAEILSRKFATDMANARVNDAILAAKRGDEAKLDALQKDLETAQALPGYGGSSAPASLRDEVKKFEGFNPKAYSDFKQTSIGYGTRAKFPGEVITKDEAEKRLDAELQNAAEIVDSVNPNLPPGARAAMISLTYNAGGGWADAGLGNAIRNGDMETAKKLFTQYTKAGGEDHPGLMKRRAQEVRWFDESTGKFGEMAQTALPRQSDATSLGPPTAAQYMSTADKQRALAKIDAARRQITADTIREDAIVKRQESMDAANEEMNIMKQLSDPQTAGQVTYQSIANNPVFNRTNEAGIQRMTAAQAALRAHQRDIVDKQERSLGEAFLPLFNRIHSAGSDRITDKGELVKYLDGGGLFYNGYEKLMREFDRKNGGGDEKDKSLNVYRTNLLAEAKQRIMKGGDTFMPDPGAQRNFNQFVIDLDNAIESARKEGGEKRVKDILTPNHKDYFGTMLDDKDGKTSPYIRPLSQRFGGAGGNSAGAALERAMTNGTATREQVISGIQSGAIDRTKGYQYGLGKWWAADEARPQVPVSK